MEYIPESYECRVSLADLLAAKLTEWGFARIELPRTREHVYARTCGPDLECRVYTTIDGRQCRAKDKDAIRVCLVYTGGEKTRGCGKDRRVYRVGVVEEIVDRTKERIDNITEGIERCRKCGTPTFKSKAKNQVCAALCWTKEKTEASKVERSRGLSNDARMFLAALVAGKVTNHQGRRNAAVSELLRFKLVEIDRETRYCQVTLRGRRSYQKAREAGLVAV